MLRLEFRENNYRNKKYRKCSKCNKSVKSIDFEEHRVNCHNKYICSLCGRKFSTKKYCDEHYKLHMIPNQYECKCGKLFSNSSNLRSHRKKCVTATQETETTNSVSPAINFGVFTTNPTTTTTTTTSKSMLSSVAVAADGNMLNTESGQDGFDFINSAQNVLDSSPITSPTPVTSTSTFRALKSPKRNLQTICTTSATSRLKVYEQLEVGIQELERTNHRLLLEKTHDKKHIKMLNCTIKNLEARCNELSKSLEEAHQALSMEQPKNERLLQNGNSIVSNEFAAQLVSCQLELKSSDSNASSSIVDNEPNTFASFTFQTPSSQQTQNSTVARCSEENEKSLDEDSKEDLKLITDLETTKRAYMAEQERCKKLEEQLLKKTQENQTLQSRIAQSSTNDEVNSMQDVPTVLDEIRQGQMCSRCLRSVDLGEDNSNQRQNIDRISNFTMKLRRN